MDSEPESQPTAEYEALRRRIVELERLVADGERGRAGPDESAAARENARLHADQARFRREAEELARVARALAETVDVATVGRLIVESVRSLLGVRFARVRLLHPDGSLVTIARGDVSGARAGSGQRYASGVGASGLAVMEGRPVVSDDVLADPRIALTEAMRRDLRVTGNVAVLAVPLRVKGEALGVVSASDRAGRSFSPDEVALLQAFADQAAPALENARLHEDTERRRREAEVLAELAATVNASPDLDTVLRRVADGARELCRADLGWIALREPDSEAMVRRYWQGAPPLLDRPLRIERGKGVGGLVLETGRPFRTDHYLEDPRITQDYVALVREEGAVAVMAVPIQGDDRLEGLLYVENRSPRPFTARDETSLVRLASQATVALRNTRMLQELQVRQSRLEALLQVSLQLSRIQPMPSLLASIAEACGLLLGAHSVGFRIMEGDDLVATATWGEKAMASMPRLKIGESLSGTVAATGETLVVRDPADDPRLIPAHREDSRRLGYRGWLGVPVKVGDRVAGVLAIRTQRVLGFSPADVAVATALASQAATALENARLYEEARHAYQELSHAQAQLVQAQRMEAVGRLAGGVAHDFNNLLTVITGRSEILRRQLDTDDPRRKQVELIYKTAERAAGLTQQLLAFSRKQVLQPKVLDLNLVVTDMERMLRRLIGEHIELVTAPGPGLGRVRADRGQLEQVLLNLVVNARDAMPEGGRLTIATANVDLDAAFAQANVGARPGPHVLVDVSDTGVGMDSETRSHVFEPFFTTKELGKGTGLGLATVYGIVKQHNGYIATDSEPGGGASFRVYLPCVEGAAEGGTAGPGLVEQGRGSETVLLVEDEEDLRDLAREVLQVRGYTVLEARHPGEALLIGERHPGPIHLVVTDVVMPQMNGRELTARLSTVRPDAKVLYMSGYTDDTVVRHAVRDAGTAFLQKPFTPDALACKVREVLDSPACEARAP